MTMTTLKRGTEVLVLAFGNKQLRRRVWEDLERGVAICREEEYQRACRDEDEATCTVFPKEDILEVYEEREEQSSNDRPL